MLVFPSCLVVRLADRIRCAYLRRYASHAAPCVSWGVWNAAAGLLLDLHRADPSIPLDPELFVAAQVPEPGLVDPWSLLTSRRAERAYRQRILHIVNQLRREIQAEIRLGRRRLRSGVELDALFAEGRRKISPLGYFALAVRAGRPDLAQRFRGAAHAQHQACPLYRQAVAGLIPADLYPGEDAPPGDEPIPLSSAPDSLFRWN